MNGGVHHAVEGGVEHTPEEGGVEHTLVEGEGEHTLVEGAAYRARVKGEGEVTLDHEVGGADFSLEEEGGIAHTFDGRKERTSQLWSKGERAQLSWRKGELSAHLWREGESTHSRERLSAHLCTCGRRVKSRVLLAHF